MSCSADPWSPSSQGRRCQRRLRIGLLVFLLVLLVLPLGSSLGQEEPPAPPPWLDVIPLTSSVRQNLLSLQNQWVEWLSVLYTDQTERDEALIESLQASARQIGFRRLPEMSVGAALRAVEAARQGESERAARALRAAEQLDPGRAETRFAAAAVARAEGRWLSAVWSELEAFSRLVRAGGLAGRLALVVLIQWLLATVLVTGGLFVASLMAAQGAGMLQDVGQLATGKRDSPAALALAAAILLWPLILPSGVALALLWWSMLLWRRAGSSQRIVLVVVWLLAAGTPLVVERQAMMLEDRLGSPSRVLDRLIEGSLYGGLFNDLAELARALPADPAVTQVLADVHRGLDQWDEARRLYMAVLEQEPENPWALLDLGAYYYYKGDYGNAQRCFEEVTRLAPDNIDAYYNLSQAYSEQYLFEDARRALGKAQQLDDLQVSRFLHSGDQVRISTYDGGFTRTAEIRERLNTAAEGEDGGAAGTAHLLWVVVLVVGGLGLAPLWRRVDHPRESGGPSPSHPWPVLALVPGLASQESGRGGLALAAQLPFAALVALAALPEYAYPLVMGYRLGDLVLSLVAWGGIFVVLAVRLVLRGIYGR